MKSKKLRLTVIILSVLMLILIAAGTLLTLRYYRVIGPYISKRSFLKDISDIKIPIVEIDTDGSVKSREEYTSCSFSLYNCENQEYNIEVKGADAPNEEGGVGIRLRGNTTANALKKSYRIKFNEKTSVLGMTKNKSWVLLADYYDQSAIRNYTALSLAKELDNLDFTPTPNHVALIMNGQFKGLYLLCEQIDEEKGRLDIEVKQGEVQADDNSFPFHVVIDSELANSDEPSKDYFRVEWAHVEMKYPDYEERHELLPGESDPIFDYAKEYMQAVFTALKTQAPVSVSFSDTPLTLDDLVDIDSMVDYYLLNEIMLNCDSCIRSLHLHKEKNGKLEFGPVWDFDWSLSAGDWDLPYEESEIGDAQVLEIANRSRIFKEFLKNPDYYQRVADRYNEKRSAIIKIADSLKDYKSVIKHVALLDGNKWYGRDYELEFTSQYDYVRLFLYDRHDFLKRTFND